MRRKNRRKRRTGGKGRGETYDKSMGTRTARILALRKGNG